jgi:hypothetical protein
VYIDDKCNQLICMQNRVKFKELEGCSSHEENTKESMEERDANKKPAGSH